MIIHASNVDKEPCNVFHASPGDGAVYRYIHMDQVRSLSLGNYGATVGFVFMVQKGGILGD